jgi:hypothetical protein
VAAAGLGRRPRSDANLRARGSRAAPGSPPRRAAVPPTSGGNVGRSRCSLRRRRRSHCSPLLAWRRWTVDLGRSG